ncbi:MAG TPA: type II secretion system protein [Flavobacteriales bacterium]|nr:type II secretion system protein [Flavobacteriales bacterium]HMR28507.1 type II secretion system protein [Flavobacteriales bacterium]
MNRTPSFTLLEALLALVMLAIVAAMSSLVIGYLGEQRTGMGDRSEQLDERLSLLTAWATDLNDAARSVQVLEDGLNVRVAAKVVHYGLVQGALVRHAPDGPTDTLIHGLDGMKVVLAGERLSLPVLWRGASLRAGQPIPLALRIPRSPARAYHSLLR